MTCQEYPPYHCQVWEKVYIYPKSDISVPTTICGAKRVSLIVAICPLQVDCSAVWSLPVTRFNTLGSRAGLHRRDFKAVWHPVSSWGPCRKQKANLIGALKGISEGIICRAVGGVK